MIYREAVTTDIPQMQIARHAVKENRLSNPALVTDADCEDFITRRGKGWVCEANGTVVGFSIADLVEHNVWALFVHPDFEQRGIGRKLHDVMMEWFFEQTDASVWLSTDPVTRAFKFYTAAGWTHAGFQPNGEARFEMSRDQFFAKQSNVTPTRDALFGF